IDTPSLFATSRVRRYLAMWMDSTSVFPFLRKKFRRKKILVERQKNSRPGVDSTMLPCYYGSDGGRKGGEQDDSAGDHGEGSRDCTDAAGRLPRSTRLRSAPGVDGTQAPVRWRQAVGEARLP